MSIDQKLIEDAISSAKILVPFYKKLLCSQQMPIIKKHDSKRMIKKKNKQYKKDCLWLTTRINDFKNDIKEYECLL